VQALVDRAETLSVTNMINLASCLISISRFDLAKSVLARLDSAVLSSRTKFEYGMLLFMISNRHELGANTNSAYRIMQDAIMEGGVPPFRAMDACSQALSGTSKTEKPMKPMPGSAQYGASPLNRVG
jgi:hypothetical protein